MRNFRASTLVLVLSVSGFISNVFAMPAVLQEAAPNQWVKLEESASGARRQPLFLYIPDKKIFVMAGGIQGQEYGKVIRHYDTEEFNLATMQWINAYPAGLEKDRPVSGPLDDQYSEKLVKYGWSGEKNPLYKDGDSLRIAAGGQWAPLSTRSFAWCYVPGEQRIYVSPLNRMLVYDVAKREWSELEAAPRAHSFDWGSMCFDPVNRELVHTGGGSGSDEVATWLFSLADNKWRKLDCGSEALRGLYKQAFEVNRHVIMLAGRCASRHAVAETADEAKVDLAAEARKLIVDFKGVVTQIKLAKVAANEAEGAAMAVKRLAELVTATEALAGELKGAMTPALVAAARELRLVSDQVVDALAPEPPGRARSQMAYDAKARKIVLFGGDGLDRSLSDTWIYDCANRTWQQRFPEKVPAPRAGHILGWLPRGGKIVLAGGYSRIGAIFDIWSYDVAANQWLLLSRDDKAKANGLDAPVPDTRGRRGIQVGAVTEEDIMVCASQGNDSNQRITWGCRVDAAKGDAAGTTEFGVAPGSYLMNPIDPAKWEQKAAEAKQGADFIAKLPENQWVSLQFPQYAPGARNRWGTSAYDTDRHQFLLWGGGHSTSCEDDVAHYSVRGGFWTIGYHPDDPIEISYAVQPTLFSFRDRPHVPIHAYKSYAYDPILRKMVYLDRVYDPVAREWEKEPLPGLEHRGSMNTHLRTTPNGIIAVSNKGFYRLDGANRQWVKLPHQGASVGSNMAWCDGPCMVTDTKRNCGWMFQDKKIFKYDFATGEISEVQFEKPAALTQWLVGGGEAVYVPKADLVISMGLAKREDDTFGTYGWSPVDSQFYWLDIPFVEKDKKVEFKSATFSWHDALAYDPVLDVVLLNSSNGQKIWALKLNEKTLQKSPMAVVKE